LQHREHLQPERSSGAFISKHAYLSAILIYYHLAVTVFLLIVTVNIAVNWRLFVAPRPRRFEPPANGQIPLVSILVPARNEALRISPCLRSLIRQDYPNYEVIVLDDHSEDQTARIVSDLGFSRDPVSARRLLTGEPLPAGWTGKAWACQQLAAAARGSYLLFTDADTVHEPEALGAFIGHARDTDAGLLSAWPRQVTRTWSERAVIPLVYVLLLGALPHGILIYLQHRPDKARRGRREWLRALGAANGQFMLFRRDVYELIGGHAAVRDHLVEDVVLGRLVAERTGDGIKLVNCDGSRLVHCRMYESFADLWQGFTKNLRPAFSGSAVSFWVFGFIQAAGLFFPFVLACLPGLNGRWWWVPVLQVVWLYAIRAALTARFRTSWLGAWLHPVGHGLSLVIGLNSWRLSGQTGVMWKGRVYTMNKGASDGRSDPVSGP
jgi:chlorobactene glucosyltransferase